MPEVLSDWFPPFVIGWEPVGKVSLLKQYILGGGLEQCQSDGGNCGGGGMVQ